MRITDNASSAYEKINNTEGSAKITENNIPQRRKSLFSRLGRHEKAIFTPQQVLSITDDDIRKLILENTYIVKDGKEISLKDALNNKKIDQSSPTGFLSALVDTLKKIKKEDPVSFEAIQNLKKEKKGLNIKLYMNGWPYDESISGAFNYVENTLRLKANEPEKETYYHELVHAADDGKIANSAEDTTDFASSNYAVSGTLPSTIDNYRADVLNEWAKDYDRFGSLLASMRRLQVAGEKVKSGKANASTKEFHAELKQKCRQELTYFSNKYWFIEPEFGAYDFDFTIPGMADTFIINNDGSVRHIAVPYILGENTEIVARGSERLEYADNSRKSVIRNDRRLMEILRDWKKLKPR